MESKSEKVPVSALRSASIDLLSGRLNPHRVIPTDEGLPRDWRGLAHLIGVNSADLERIAATSNPTEHLIKFWAKGSVKMLREFLEMIDRYDVIDDTDALIEKDLDVYLTQTTVTRHQEQVKSTSDASVITIHDVSRLSQGLGPQIYDAFILHADEDVDFAMEIVTKLEQDFNMMVCLRDHLVGGITFEHDAVTKLIAERCRRVLIVVSPAFLESQSNKFIVTFAQAVGIDRRERKLIPIIYKKCMLPPELSYYFSLKYYLKLPWDFWETLRKSIEATEAPVVKSSSPWMTHSSPQFKTSPTQQLPLSEEEQEIAETLKKLAELKVENSPLVSPNTSVKSKNPLSKAYKFMTSKTQKESSEGSKDRKKKFFARKKAVKLAAI